MEIRFFFNIHNKCFSVLAASEAVGAYTNAQTFTINLYNLSAQECKIRKKWEYNNLTDEMEKIDVIAQEMQQVGISHMDYYYFHYEIEEEHPEFLLFANEVEAEGEDAETREYIICFWGVDELLEKNGGYIYPVNDLIKAEMTARNAEQGANQNAKEAVKDIDLKDYVYSDNLPEETGGNLLEIIIKELYDEKLQLVVDSDGILSYHAGQPAIKIGASMNNDGYLVELSEPVDGFLIYGIEPEMAEEEMTAILERQHIVKNKYSEVVQENQEWAEYPIDDNRYLTIEIFDGVVMKVRFSNYLSNSYDELGIE